MDRRPEDNQYCVINPLTRTCKVLPTVPFPPYAFVRSSSPVAITGFQAHQGRRVNCDDWVMATCDLLEGSGRWTLVDGLVPRRLPPAIIEELPYPELFAVCGRDIVYCFDSELHLISAAAAAEGAAALTAAVTSGPSRLHWPASLDLEWLESAFYSPSRNVTYLVAHQGSFFLVAEVEQLGPGPAMSCGIWSLVRSRMVWETAAWVGMGVHQLLWPYYEEGHPFPRHNLLGAWGAGDLLCLEFGLDNSEGSADYVRVMLGLSLKTGAWERLHYDGRRLSSSSYGSPLELRRDSFLF